MTTRTLLFGLTLVLGASLGFAETRETQKQIVISSDAPQQASCDEEAISINKAEFLRLRGIYQRRPDQVDKEEFRQAAQRYIFDAESCYQARYGVPATGKQIIDHGGVRMGASSGSGYAVLGNYDATPQHVLGGTKWGAGSPFAGGTDTTGPRLPGGTVTYSYMADGLSLAADPDSIDATTTAVSSLVTFESCFQKEIGDSFGAWSAVADIEFVPVSDAGGAFNTGATGDIRIAAHDFCTDPAPGPCMTLDGPSGILAHAFFPPPNGVTAAGDLHFDKSEAWACDDDGSSIDIGVVALHEIGHSLGLDHELTDTAVMEPFYNAALTFGPLADDIIGAGEIYGEAGAAETAFFGDLGIGTDSPSASLHVLRDDSTAKIRVEETSTSVANRTMFFMENNGGAAFELVNNNLGVTWRFNNHNPTAEFRVSVAGSGQQEFKVDTSGNLEVTGTVTPMSSREAKENFQAISPGEILRKVDELPVLSWNYKSDDPGVRHLGPMGEDFYETFGLGKGGKGISVTDTAGLAFASIQALNSKIDLLENENAELKAQITEILRRLAVLEALVNSIVTSNGS